MTSSPESEERFAVAGNWPGTPAGHQDSSHFAHAPEAPVDWIGSGLVCPRASEKSCIHEAWAVLDSQLVKLSVRPRILDKDHSVLKKSCILIPIIRAGRQASLQDQDSLHLGASGTTSKLVGTRPD